MGMAAATAAGTAAGTTAVNRIADKLGASKMNKGKMIKKEGVEEQSELILAAKDMMDKVTGYLEDLASMKTEGMLELADRIRDEMGADKADAFIQKIQPAIEQAEATLSTTRQELDNGVRILTGEEVASEPMGADDTMDLDTDTDSLDSVDMDDTESDEFGASDAEAGGTEPEGREQRESKEVFESSNRLYSKLAGK
jgi:vacuolar-type H+-ATPase subunit I/STV1